MKNFRILLAAALMAATAFCTSCEKKAEVLDPQAELAAVSGGWYDDSDPDLEEYDALFIRDERLLSGSVLSGTGQFVKIDADYHFATCDERGLDFTRNTEPEEHVLIQLNGEGRLQVAWFTIPDNGMYRKTTMVRGQFEF